MSRRELLSTLLIAVVTLAACARPAPAPQFRLRMGFFPTQDYLPYFVMQEQGFAERNGLQFEEAALAGGAAVIEAEAAGVVDVGVADAMPILGAAERGLIPDQVVPAAANNFADPSHPGSAALVASSVNTWRDLQGQQVAVPVLGSITAVAMQGRLEQEGVREYAFVEIGFANMGLAVAGGNVVAAVMSEPFLTQSLLRGDGKLLGWVAGGPPFETMQFTSWLVSADLYHNNPQAAKAFLRATLEAVQWMNQNPDKARSILVKRLGLTPEVGEKVHLLHWPLDARNDPALLESVEPLMVQMGLLKAQIPAQQLYDETLLEQVLAEKR